MSHLKYSPVGYSFKAANYCLDCMPKVAAIPGKGNGGNGLRRGECNCCECRLDRMAAARGIDRYDERSFDSGNFPKSIPYHNEIHLECASEGELACNMHCASCGDVIDGANHIDGPDTCPTVDAEMARREELTEKHRDTPELVTPEEYTALRDWEIINADGEIYADIPAPDPNQCTLFETAPNTY